MVIPNPLPETGLKTGAGTKNRDEELRRLLGEAFDRSRKHRREVAQEMKELLGQPVTETMLYEFTRTFTKQRCESVGTVKKERGEVRFPATWVSAFCEVTGSDELARFVMGPRLRELLELGERVSSMGWVLRTMQDEFARLTGSGLQKKAKGKRTRKA
jgi:hypothetical protein